MKNQSQNAFQAILSVAHEIERTDPRGLFQLIRLCGLASFTRYVSWRLQCPDDKAVRHFDADHLWFQLGTSITDTGKSFYDLCPETDETRTVDLAKDLVVPYPWNRGRMAESLALIGLDRERGEWEEDPDNHQVEVWLPLGIAWVHNGYHSVTAGIASGKGTVTAEIVRDITPVYEHVYCDGVGFYRRQDRQLIADVNDLEFAAIFEIGRLMAKTVAGKSQEYPKS